MDTQQLQYFLQIIACGSISRAAAELGLSQPSLSQSLLRLEDELGVRLFERTARGVLPTEAATLLAEHAANILKYVDLARESVRQQGDAVSGEVVFGTPSSITLFLGVPLIRAAHSSLPGVSLRVAEAMSGDIRTWAEGGLVDLAVLYNASAVRNLRNTHLLTENLYFIAPGGTLGPVDRQGVALKQVAFSELAEHRLILPSQRHGLRRYLDQHARANGVELNVFTEIDALAQIRALVEDGVGCTVLSLPGVYEELTTGRLVASCIIEPELRRSVHIVRNPSKPPTRASIAVERLAVSIMRRLVDEGRWRATLAAKEQP